MLRTINLRILKQLREDLRGTFHVIAHAGHASNGDWIRARQEELRKEYRWIEPTGRGAEVALPIRRGRRHSYIESEEVACSIFMTLEPNGSPEDIAQTCEEALNDYILS